MSSTSDSGAQILMSSSSNSIHRPHPQSSRSRLCLRCKYFDIQSFDKGSTRRRGYLLYDVKSAAEKGCEFCSLLRDSIADIEEPRNVYPDILGRVVPLRTQNDQYVHLTLSRNYGSVKTAPETEGEAGMRLNRMLVEIGPRYGAVRNASKWELCLAADPDSPAARDEDISGCYLGTEVDSSSHYKTIRAWMKGCDSHPRCQQTVSGAPISQHPPLPSRCIHIPPSGKLSLLETKDQFGEYITATHRWNAHTELCKTTTSNYRNRLKEIPLDIIPQLFKDMITIAKKLGIIYIWIDSICIIQSGDDGKDWREEAPKMAQYYQMSKLTIAGTMEDTERGLLENLSPATAPFGSKLVRLPYRNRSHSFEGHFYVYQRQVLLLDDYQALIRDTTLFKRGWVLQEWLLSKRLLYYTPKGLMYECSTNWPRTDSQEAIPSFLEDTDLRAGLELKSSFHSTNPDIFQFWYAAIETYSTCQLTMPEKDRLLAVAGLAKEVVAILNNRKGTKKEFFVSGLWLGDLHHGLLWELKDRGQPPFQRLEEAPSWSWASILAPLTWPKRNPKRKKECMIVGVCQDEQGGRHNYQHPVVNNSLLLENPDISSAEDGPEPLARMSGCLHIRGRMYPVHVRGYLNAEQQTTAAFASSYDKPAACHRWRALCAPENPEIIAGWGSLERAEDPETCSDAGFAVMALHISTRYLQSGFWIKRTESVFDVIFIEESNGVFRRVGVGRVFDENLVRSLQGAVERDLILQ